jgi:hypothetical protein
MKRDYVQFFTVIQVRDPPKQPGVGQYNLHNTSYLLPYNRCSVTTADSSILAY